MRKLQQRKQQRKLQQKKILKKRKISNPELIPVGKFGKTHGLFGELKFISFCNPIENILLYKNFYLEPGKKINIQIKSLGSSLIVKIDQIEKVNDAKSFINKEIFITEEELKAIDKDSIYWKDLIGSEVINQSNESLGEVIKIENHGASDLLFVKGVTEQVIPVTDEFFKSFDLQNKIIIVEWEEI